MLVSASKIVMRCLTGLCGAAAFLVTASVAVKEFLPGDQLLEQRFYFQIEGDCSDERGCWADFARDQQACITARTGKISALSPARLRVTVGEFEPVIAVRVRCRVNSDIGGSFRGLLQAYIKHRAQVEAQADDSQSGRDAGRARFADDPLAQADLKLRRQYVQIARQQHEQLAQLRLDYSRQSTEALNLERQAAGKNPAEFEESIRSEVERVLADDMVIRQSGQLLDELDEQMARLDLQAGITQSRAELKQLDESREVLNRRCQQLGRQIDRRHKRLAEQVQKRLWPGYRTRLDNRIARKHEEIASNSDLQRTVAANLQRVEDKITALDEQLRGVQQGNHPVAKAVFRAKLDLDQSQYSRRFVISRRQQLVLVLSGLAGFAVGLLAPVVFAHGDRGTVKDSAGDSGGVTAGRRRRRERVPGSEKAIEAMEGPRDRGSGQVRKSSAVSSEQEITAESMSGSVVDSEVESADEPIAGAATAREPTVESAAESAPLATINLREDQVGSKDGLVGGGWGRHYDHLADTIERLRDEVSCPAVIISALDTAEVSARLAVNMAIALTKKSLRVLLVEADQDSSDLAQVFELEQEPGFFEWRRGAAWVSQAAHATQLVGLSVMPSGLVSAEQGGTEIDLNKELHRWGNLPNNFDVVLLYSPAALIAEPQSLQQRGAAQLPDLADGVVCLARPRHDTSEVAVRAEAILAGRKARLLGVVAVKK